MTMNAAVLLGRSSSRIDTIPVPSPGAHEVLVRLQGTGVCASNLPVWQGRDWFTYPAEPGAPGHEGWGTVERVGEAVTTVVPGKRVALLSSRAYAEYDVAREDHVAPLPSALDGRPVPGEPLACAMNIHARAGIREGDVVAVIGIGFLGAVLTRLAALDGARVIAVSRRPFALRLAERLGAASTIPFRDVEGTSASIAGLTGEALAPVVIECVGTQGALDLATRACGIRGRMLIAGYHQDGHRTVDLQAWNWKGLDVINAHEREPARYVAGMQAAVALLERGALDVSELLGDPLPLSQIDRAFELSVRRPDGFVKAVIDPWRDR